jgi:alpha-mannosidase
MPNRTREDQSISIIGYSHIDTCWFWPFSLTRYKIVNTAAAMLHLMELPPQEFGESAVEWRFLATAAQHYKWLKEDSPEIYAKVLKAIHQGSWEVNGGVWVEPDTTLLSGESLVRQLALGIRYFEKEFAAKQTVLILPDCFGFSGNLPQILLKAGIDSFVTSKVSWSEYTQFPYSTFMWRGIDGSDVFTHFITTPSSWSEKTATYTGTSTAYEMIGTLKAYKQKDILPHSALHTSGNGDGGGGITEEMVWNLNLMAECPEFRAYPGFSFRRLRMSLLTFGQSEMS